MSYTDRSHQWGRFFTSLVVLGIVAAMYLGGMYVAAGQVVVEKALLHLAMPAGIIWILLTFFCIQLRDCKTSPLFAVAALSWIAFTAFGSGHLKSFLVERLEFEFAENRPLDEKEPFEAIVVLGGGCSGALNGETQTNSAGERVVLAARMYHKGLVKKIICTGKRIKELDPDGTDPADRSEIILTQLDVPAGSIEKMGGINTSEELKKLGERFNNQQRVGLITSAWHMQRALRLAKANNFSVHPLPGGFKSGEQRPWTTGSIMLSIIPNAEAFNNTTWAMREYLAGLVGR